MKEIPLTNYQLISYFTPGFVVVLSFFLCNEPISTWSTFVTALKDLSVALIAAATICSFIVGLVIDGLRNGLFESLFDRIEKKLPQQHKINWKFFYEGPKEAVALFYARYFTYYCFNFNMSLSLLLSLVLLDGYSQLPHKWILSISIVIGIFILVRDGWSLREEMADATNYNYP